MTTALQRRLCKEIATDFTEGASLIPLTRHSQFQVVSLPVDLLWAAYRPTWDLVWVVVADVMAKAAPHQHVIDHQWLFGYSSGWKESWGFVTEPYLDDGEAEVIARIVREQTIEWGIDIHVLPREKSSWNPGHTVPIVAIVREGGVRSLVAHALPIFFGAT